MVETPLKNGVGLNTVQSVQLCNCCLL